MATVLELRTVVRRMYEVYVQHPTHAAPRHATPRHATAPTERAVCGADLITTTGVRTVPYEDCSRQQ